MVCSRKPTSSTASPGPHFASVVFSPAGRPYVHGDPSFDNTIDPSFDATIDPLSLSISSVNVNCTIKSLRAPQGFQKILPFCIRTRVRVSRKSNRFAWGRNSGGSEMVRPSKNWERLVRATLRREKLRHDGHERAPIGIASFVLPSLTRETNIDLILPAADEIQSEEPNVARICKGLVSLEIQQLCHPKRLGFSAFVSRRPSASARYNSTLDFLGYNEPI